MRCTVNIAVIAGLLATVAVPGLAAEPEPGHKGIGVIGGSTFAPVAESTGHAALFIGVNEFTEDNGLATLNFAVNDAVATAHLFVLELKLVQPERAILALSGKPRGETPTAQLAALQAAGARVVPASKSRIFRQLQQVTAMPQQPEDLLLVSLSSHGFEEGGVPYAMPADGVRAFLADTAINLTSVEEALARSKAGKRLLLLDACREKPLAGGKGGGAAMTPAFRAKLAEARGQAVLASCDVGQISFEDPKLGHGIFTHYLLSALRGQAKPDAQGLIRLDSVVTYVAQEVENWSRQHGAVVQQPWFKGPQIAAHIPLAVDPGAAEAAKERLRKLRAMALDDRLTLEEFKEAEQLLKGAGGDEMSEKRRTIYERLADGKTDVETAKLALAGLRPTARPEPTPPPAADEPDPARPDEEEPTHPAPAPQPATSGGGMLSAEQIVDRHLQAIGGADALKRVHNYVAKGRAVMLGFPGEFKWYAEAPDKVRYEIKLSNGAKVKGGCNGHYAWEDVGDVGPAPKHGDWYELALRSAHFNADLDWRSIFHTAQSKGIWPFEGRNYYVVTLFAHRGPPVTGYYDMTTGLLSGVEMVVNDPNLGPVNVMTVLGNYRDFGDGVLRPGSMAERGPNYQAMYEFDSIESNRDISPRKFKVPDEVREVIDAGDWGGGDSGSGS